ncbi:hypothetical protein [Arthrobacter sp. SLBN-122]|uniref:hypothetical protein n=1 Tax=Arthrobacter sp. SLBN-122 TaxID=2768455 RepID=UPI001154EB8C|nr:hypothetical protein [Arthrobacter sp. SLBN-122]TQJ35766.1 hypothetical protein FBY36_3045 [Arthrobacter sp. SLBN-122]
MNDFLNDEPLMSAPSPAPATSKLPNLPKRPERRSASSAALSSPQLRATEPQSSRVLVIGKKDEAIKPVQQQLEETIRIFAEAEQEELQIKRSAPALPSPTKAVMPSIQKIMESKQKQTEEATPAEKFVPTQRDLLILTLLNEVQRLTCDQIAFVLVAQQNRPLSDIPRVSESLRRTNLVKLQNNGSIKKISPTGKITPFFILTRVGAEHVDYRLPVNNELLSPTFDHNSLDVLEHKTISNLASVILQIRTGTILLEDEYVNLIQDH